MKSDDAKEVPKIRHDEEKEVSQAKRRKTDVAMICYIDHESKKEEVLKKIRQEKPHICSVNISGNCEKSKRIAYEVCLEQFKQKRSFVIEGLCVERFWQDEDLKRLLDRSGVYRVVVPVGCTEITEGTF